MQYLYHFVPKNLQGNILFPLNRIKGIYPDIYTEEVKKYEGREFIKEQKIPILNCLWNDVLHFTSLQPQLVKNALMNFGLDRNFKYFQIPSHMLNIENTIVYLNNSHEGIDKMDPLNFRSYNPDNIEQYAYLPQETTDYYKAMIKEGKKPLLYKGVPHILYKGELEITNLEVKSTD